MSLSIYHTQTHSLGRMSERGEVLSSERERQKLWRSSLCFRVLLLPLVLILSLRKLRGFLLYGFPKENSLCLLSLVFIDVHVILSNKILRSYCLIDKNITTRLNTSCEYMLEYQMLIVQFVSSYVILLLSFCNQYNN